MSWYATTLDLNTGVISSGALSDTYADDTNELVLTELGQTPGFDYDFTFTGLPNTNLVVNLAANYDGSGTHNVKLYIYNYDTPGWDAVTGAAQDLPDNATKQYYTFTLPDTPIDDYLSAGVLKIKISHDNNGNAAHFLHIDELKLDYQFSQQPSNARIAPSIGGNANIVYSIDATARIAPTIPCNARILIEGAYKIGRVYCVGGYSTEYSAANEAIDPFENTWINRAPLVTPRTKLAMGTDEFAGYAFGGLGAPTEVNKYDPEPDIWTTKAGMASGRYSHGAVGVSICETDLDNVFDELKSRIYVLGGRDVGNQETNTNNEYDPDLDTFTSKTAITSARSAFGCGAINQRNVYVTGGDSALDTNYEYDPLTDSWVARDTLTTGRRENTSTGNANYLYTYGGSDATSSLKSLERYDPVADGWTVETPAVISRGRATSGLCYEDYEKIVVAGGLEEPAVCTTGTPTQLTETYDLAADAWTTKANMPTGRMDLANGFIRGVPRTRVWQSLTGRANIQPSEKYINGQAKIRVEVEQEIYSSAFLIPRLDATAAIWPGQYANARIIEAIALYAVARISPSIKADARIQTEVEQTIGADAFIGTSLKARAIVLNLRIRGKARIRPVITCLARVRPRLTAKARVRPILKGTAWIKAYWERLITAAGRVRPNITGGGRIAPSISGTGRIAPSIGGNGKIVIWPSIPANGHIETELMALGKVYVIGGWKFTYDNKTTINEEYEAIHDIWSSKQDILSKRVQHGIGSSILQSKLYSVGGTGSTGVEEQNLEYNPDTDSWTTKSPISPGRKNNAVTNVCDFNGYEEIFTIGGRAKYTGLEMSNVDAYDPVLDTWVARSNIFPSTDNLAAGTVDFNKIYVSGGESGFSEAIKTTQEYNPSTNIWTSKADLNVGRQEHTSSGNVETQSCYSFDGMNNLGQAINSTEKYDPSIDAWIVRTSSSIARDRIVSECINYII
jgi:N-acetylneuraminic acid mutarotase